ncbi:hypothetical protein [Glaciecola sp. MF2-115]|uniref:hypothetical protein n=1 Tax=Glaciecola sp. MF2-115 TaxID=3384827 RepID=UPI0039A21CEF
MTEINLQANELTWNITTICPMDIKFGFPLGSTQDNPDSISTLIKMSQLDSAIRYDINESVSASDVFKGSEYVSIADDVSTLRLFSWHAKIANKNEMLVDVVFHVFPNHIAVAEIKLTDIAANSAKQLDRVALMETEFLLNKAQLVFNQVLDNLEEKLADTNAIFEAKESTGKVYWPSRAIQLSNEQLSQNESKAIVEEWLEDTHRPEDTELIFSGQKSESITWLKYVILECSDGDESNVEKDDYRLETLILAQYCYSAQEKCNRKVRQAIEQAFEGENKKLESEIQRAKRALERSRVLLKLHQVSVNECLRHLTRRKSWLIKDIFACWEYERLVDNGNAMLDLCADKINDSDSRQAKISASKTEYILIGISLFTVLDFFFFITQFSREAMANPTLDHNDGGPSEFLTMIADIPADTMFFAAVVIAGLIFVTYKKVKG